jgi:hypothetical protein
MGSDPAGRRAKREQKLGLAPLVSPAFCGIVLLDAAIRLALKLRILRPYT